MLATSKLNAIIIGADVSREGGVGSVHGCGRTSDVECKQVSRGFDDAR